MSEITFEVALVDTSRRPLENTFALLFVVLIVSIILIFQDLSSLSNGISLDTLLEPLSFPLLQSVDKSSFEKAFVSPDILSEPIWQSFSVVTDVDITIMILFSPFSMLH